MKSACFILCALLLSAGAARSQTDSIQKVSDAAPFDRDTTYGFDFEFSESFVDQVNADSLKTKLLHIKKRNDSLLDVIKARNIAWRSDSLLQLYHLLQKDVRKSYNSWYVVIGPAFADLGEINNRLLAASLPALNNMHLNYNYIFSLSRKRNRFMHDFYVGFLHGRKVKQGNIKVSYTNMNLLNYFLGFSIINSKRLDVFPYAGVDFQFSDLTFQNTFIRKPPSGITSFDSIIDFIQMNNEGSRVIFSKAELVFNYGLEVDFHLKYSKRSRGFILGFRGGRTRPLINSGWGGGTLPDIVMRDYYLNMVLKFYRRRTPAPDLDIGYRARDYGY